MKESGEASAKYAAGWAYERTIGDVELGHGKGIESEKEVGDDRAMARVYRRPSAPGARSL